MQCLVAPPENTPNCTVRFGPPYPEKQFGGEIFPDAVPNSVMFEEGTGFMVGYSPGSEPFSENPVLEPGQTVEISGNVFERFADGTFTVKTGGHEYTIPPTAIASAEPGTASQQIANMNDSCGELNGSYVVATENGTTCDIAMEVMTDYTSGSPSGTPPQGSAGFWTAPNGWGCASDYNPETKSAEAWCGASDRSGQPAMEGSGAVTLIAP